jgi:uncharacterized membrane protein YeaQ/YmgE (transglycosylase-associated protein family)
LGFFYRLTVRRRGAFLLGAAVSFGIEVVQLFVPARTPSIVDVLANALGSGLGALSYDLLSTRIRFTKSMVGILRLETPLMVVIYLLGPLLWVNALRLRDGSERWLLTLLVGLCGALILSEVFRHWWETTSVQIAMYAAGATGAWFLIGAGPAFRYPLPIATIGLGLMFITALLTVIPSKSIDRRFELATLQRIFPVFGLYLLLLALWPLRRSLRAWHVTLGFTNLITETSMQVLYPRIEYVVAFTVLGYLLAEWRGRYEIPLAQDLPRLFIYSLGIALALEFLVGFQSGPGASLIRVGMVVVSALFGGTIYHLARAHIRFLLGR